MKELTIAIGFLIFGIGISYAAMSSNSYVLADGVNRAPAVTLHCASSSNAIPCGIAANPIIVGLPSGSSTSSNQLNEIAYEQSILNSIGSPADNSYSSGSGSAISILKALLSQLVTGVSASPIGGGLISRSQTVPSQVSVQLFPANPFRRYLAFQVPQGNGVWINLMGGVASNGGVDCAYFSPGTFYESGQFVNRNALNVFSLASATISAWEN